MKEITVKEFMQAVNNGVYDVESMDTYGVHIEMSKARISYDEDFDEINFTSGNHNKDGLGSITYNVENCIECISVDEESGVYTIEFSQYMADVEIRKAVL